MPGIKNKIVLSYEESHRINEDGNLEKFCNRCELWFPCTDEFFYNNPKSPDGLFPYCKECNKKRTMESKWSDIENYREKQRIKFKIKYDTKPEVRERQSINSNKTREKGYYIGYRRLERVKLKYKEYNNKHQQNKFHEITEEEWQECLEEFNFCCAYCGTHQNDAKIKYKQNLHKEHAYNEGSNKIDNCVPACRSCNSKKLKKDWDKWYNKDNPLYTVERFLKIKRRLEKYNPIK